MSRYKLKCLTGPLAGLVYFADPIGAADTLEQSVRWRTLPHRERLDFYSTPEGKAQSEEVSECWKRNGRDGFWIEGIGRVVVGPDWEDTKTCFDKMDREIFVGDVIVYAMRDLTVSELKITHFKGKKMYGIDLHTNRKTYNSYPSRCLKVSP